MVELAAVVTFMLEAFLRSSSLLWSHLGQLDQDGMYFLSHTHGPTLKTLPYAPLPSSSPGSNSAAVKKFPIVTLISNGAGLAKITSPVATQTLSTQGVIACSISARSAASNNAPDSGLDESPLSNFFAARFHVSQSKSRSYVYV